MWIESEMNSKLITNSSESIIEDIISFTRKHPHTANGYIRVRVSRKGIGIGAISDPKILSEKTSGCRIEPSTARE